MAPLLTIEDCEKMSVEEVWSYYKKYINPGQVDLISSFGFGRDLSDHAEGVWIYTKSGRKILDFTGGVGVLNHGHNHPAILKARKEYQEKKRMEVHKNFFSPYLAALSHNIAQLLPGDLKYCYFPNSGSEAVEGAMKLAYKYHGGKRKHILHGDISFHGKLLGAAGVTGSPELHFEFPTIPNTHAFEYGNLQSLQVLVENLRQSNGDSDVYAIILEPMNASSMRECSKDFLFAVRKLCNENKIVLIFDEVYTGWAKTGSLFYFMRHDGLVPDILTMAKSLGGGKASIAGYVTQEKIFLGAYGNLNDATLHSTTYNAFGEESVTALEAVRIIVEEDYPAKSRHIHEYLRPRLLEIQKKYPTLVKDVRGAGSLNGILLEVEEGFLSQMTKLIPSEFFRDPRFLNKLVTGAVIARMYDVHGILTFYGSNREIPLVIAPSLVVQDAELDLFLDALDETLSRGTVRLCLDFIKSKFFSRR